MTVTALVGAQWGSEGKGVVAAAIADRFDMAIRVGGPNAGHSLVYEGKVYKMRGVPCGWVNPACQLVIGAGAVVEPPLLRRELSELPIPRTVYVDRQAMVVLEGHVEMEKAGAMADRIGSTQEGVGAARIEKIWRQPNTMLARDYKDWGPGVEVVDTLPMISDYARDSEVILEGTQGSGLSLHHGTYPFVTSTDTNASGIAAEAGIAPGYVRHVYLVARTLPIRVAGNSGPMGKELQWWQVPSKQAERTTVTNKVRRISEWDNGVFDRAVRLNAPCGVFLMFTDYLAPDFAGSTDARAIFHSNEAVARMQVHIEDTWGVPVLAYGTGGEGWQLAVQSETCSHGETWQ